MNEDIENIKIQLWKYWEILSNEQLIQLYKLFDRLSRKLIYQYVEFLKQNS